MTPTVFLMLCCLVLVTPVLFKWKGREIEGEKVRETAELSLVLWVYTQTWFVKIANQSH